MSSKSVKIIATAAIVLAGGAFLIWSSMADAQPYKMVDKLMQEPDKYAGKTMRVHGYVEPGSIEEKIINQSTQRTFVIENEGKRIFVKHHGPKPDTFRDRSEVVAKGKLVNENGEYVFHASELMAKCPSKYEGAPTKDHSEQKPVFD
jgi:cytochrome c-type biogenesis protein CcmE